MNDRQHVERRWTILSDRMERGEPGEAERRIVVIGPDVIPRDRIVRLDFGYRRSTDDTCLVHAFCEAATKFEGEPESSP